MSTQSVQSEPELIIITGLSGSGISTALQALEDLGYYCVDNLPPPLISKLIELAFSRDGRLRFAIGLDARGLINSESTRAAVSTLKQLSIPSKVLFLDATEEVLLRRFNVSRRPHPLSRGQLSLKEAMLAERELIADLRGLAHELIDTSDLNVHECKRRVRQFAQGNHTTELAVQLMSFGFRHGLPTEADLAWDVRFLPNPHFIEDLRPLSGLDDPVSSYVLRHQVTQDFLDTITPLLHTCLPAYQREGKAYLTLAIGCTGGRHRSVAIIQKLAEILTANHWTPRVQHRDLKKSY